jgi:hypothetical protein
MVYGVPMVPDRQEYLQVRARANLKTVNNDMADILI